ncbi:MAG: hypothetical protein ACREIA_24045 [Opitutaceae bacterium]
MNNTSQRARARDFTLESGRCFQAWSTVWIAIIRAKGRSLSPFGDRLRRTE